MRVTVNFSLKRSKSRADGKCPVYVRCTMNNQRFELSTGIFCIIDDFCIEFERTKSAHVLPEQSDKKKRSRSFTLSDSEVITILILFHAGQFRNLKHFIQRTGLQRPMFNWLVLWVQTSLDYQRTGRNT